MSGGDEFADISPLSRGRWCDADGRRGSSCVHFQRRSFMRGATRSAGPKRLRGRETRVAPGAVIAPLDSLDALRDAGYREPFEWRKLTSVT